MLQVLEQWCFQLYNSIGQGNKQNSMVLHKIKKGFGWLEKLTKMKRHQTELKKAFTQDI